MIRDDLQPPAWAIADASNAAHSSSCRSRRGVCVYIRGSERGEFFSHTGFNGPPAPFSCPGREHCAGNCGQRSVHAEARALQNVIGGDLYDLLHIEIDTAGALVACDGPSCVPCAALILDTKIRGVWLLCKEPNLGQLRGVRSWRYYTSHDFYMLSLRHHGLYIAPPSRATLPCPACRQHHDLDQFPVDTRVRTLVHSPADPALLNGDPVPAGAIGTVVEWWQYNSPMWIRVRVEAGPELRANYYPCQLEAVR